MLYYIILYDIILYCIILYYNCNLEGTKWSQGMGVVSNNWFDCGLLSILYIFKPSCRPIFKPPVVTVCRPYESLDFYQDSSKGGAVETGCSDLCDVAY